MGLPEGIGPSACWDTHTPVDRMPHASDNITFPLRSLISIQWVYKYFTLSRAHEDGFYMFTLVVREDGYSHAAGSVTRTPAADLSNAFTLCRAEQGEHAWQTGSCTVRTVNKILSLLIHKISLIHWSFSISQRFCEFVELRKSEKINGV